MSFGFYGRAVAVGPEYYHCSGEGVVQYTDCPFSPDGLPGPETSSYAKLPPPFFERQEMTSFHRDPFGKLKFEIDWVALWCERGLDWVPQARVETPVGKWSGVVPFPA